MILDLDDPRAQDPGRAGAKAAWLARGLRAGLPVLRGVVVPAELSRPAMAAGLKAMVTRGSGGARLVLTREPLDPDLEVALGEAIAPLGDPLVVRSSSILEGDGRWSGAFTSYLDIHPDEIATAVRGCWASCFTVHTLERYQAEGVEPGSVPMAVLIQPALHPDVGGVARLEGDDVVVVGVAGSPAALVQGWEPGVHARVSSGGVVRGDRAADLLGEAVIVEVASLLRQAERSIGANSCEWAAVDGTVTLLQLARTDPAPARTVEVPAVFRRPQLRSMARLARRFPGPLGEALVLPWAMAAPERFLDEVAPAPVHPVDAFVEAIEQARTLTAEVWGRTKTSADRAIAALRDLRGDDPAGAVAAFGSIRPPNPERATALLGLLARARVGLVEARAVSRPELAWHLNPSEAMAILRTGAAAQLRTRIGFDRWEPFDAAVTIAGDRWVDGTPAARGIAAGRLCFIPDPRRTEHFRPRDVVVGTHPLPNHAALLWDAAAVVTIGGGPAAHLFESARALAIPAVTSVDLEGAAGADLTELSGRLTLAVDGTTGRVWLDEW